MLRKIDGQWWYSRLFVLKLAGFYSLAAGMAGFLFGMATGLWIGGLK